MPNRNSKPWRDRNKRDRPGRGAILFGWPQTVQISGLGDLAQTAALAVRRRLVVSIIGV